MEQAETQPIRKRVEIYRALAAFAGDPADSRDLSRIADELESADKRCREFSFNLANQK